ncbi:MAG: hypothetical protein Q8N96_09585 [Methylovulum sp.]|nr:hypothetical protein [Methylovulum sp.]
MNPQQKFKKSIEFQIKRIKKAENCKAVSRQQTAIGANQNGGLPGGEFRPTALSFLGIRIKI